MTHRLLSKHRNWSTIRRRRRLPLTTQIAVLAFFDDFPDEPPSKARSITVFPPPKASWGPIDGITLLADNIAVEDIQAGDSK